MQLSCDNLTVSYRRHPAIHHLTCQFKMGETTAIVGPNGAGKSTLLKAILGEVKPDTGNVIWNGISPQDIAYLPQHSEIDNSVPLSVADVVLLGSWYQIGLLGRVDNNLNKRVDNSLEQVGLAGFNQRYITELSRGQLQRVLFARTIMQQANVILLDEPFNAMDSKTIDTLLHIIHLWKQEGKTIIAVLHDLYQVNTSFDYTMLLATKLISYGKTNTVLTRENLTQAYAHNFNWIDDIDLCENV